jgi:hypothetical protein
VEVTDAGGVDPCFSSRQSGAGVNSTERLSPACRARQSDRSSGTTTCVTLIGSYFSEWMLEQGAELIPNRVGTGTRIQHYPLLVALNRPIFH